MPERARTVLGVVRRPSPRRALAACALTLPACLLACETLSARTELAMSRLHGKADPSAGPGAEDAPNVAPTRADGASCPDGVVGRAVGAETADGAVACFRHALAERSAATLLRVTCQGRTPASCKHGDATQREAERLAQELARMPWDRQVGAWQESAGARVFAFDTQPTHKTVSTVTVCRIADGERWAVCEIGAIPRGDAERRSSAAPR